jgi:F-type H+-transporting ATPase subunit alpha
MKKVAGTLRLDLAQYRELEAFSKFGSDLDPATQAQLLRGERLVETLKQGQYEPMSVEHQVVVIYVAAQGLLDKMPADKVAEFQKELLDRLDRKQAEALKSIITSGVMSDEAAEAIKAEASELAAVYAS